MCKSRKKTKKRNSQKNRILWIVAIVASIIAIAVVMFFIQDITKEQQGENKDKQAKQELEELQEEIADATVTTVEEEPPEDPKEAEVELSEMSGFTSKADSKNAGNIAGMEFPYKVPDSSMEILSIGQYTGPFIETGQDIPTDNVLTIVVKNTGDKMIEYAEIHLNAVEEEAVFKITALPAGTAMMVQELNQLKYSKDVTYSYSSAVEAFVQEEKGMCEDLVSVTGENGKLTVTNKTDEIIPELYVCYHSIQNGGVYRGGITYRAVFEDIEAGKSKTVESAHYYENGSSILFVDIPPQSTQ